MTLLLSLLTSLYLINALHIHQFQLRLTRTSWCGSLIDRRLKSAVQLVPCATTSTPSRTHNICRTTRWLMPCSSLTGLRHLCRIPFVSSLLTSNFHIRVLGLPGQPLGARCDAFLVGIENWSGVAELSIPLRQFLQALPQGELSGRLVIEPLIPLNERGRDSEGWNAYQHHDPPGKYSNSVLMFCPLLKHLGCVNSFRPATWRSSKSEEVRLRWPIMKKKAGCRRTGESVIIGCEEDGTDSLLRRGAVRRESSLSTSQVR